MRVFTETLVSRDAFVPEPAVHGRRQSAAEAAALEMAPDPEASTGATEPAAAACWRPGMREYRWPNVGL